MVELIGCFRFARLFICFIAAFALECKDAVAAYGGYRKREQTATNGKKFKKV
jgi:hypothetical protein